RVPVGTWPTEDAVMRRFAAGQALNGTCGRGHLGFQRQVGARPLVPGAAVVARVVAEALQHAYRERRARAAVAVTDAPATVGHADPLAQLLLGQRHQLLHVEVERTGDVALARIARRAEASVVLLCATDIDDAKLDQPRRELVELDVAHRRAL